MAIPDHERSLSGPGDETPGIVRAVRAGDRERFAELCGRIAPAVYAWAALRIPAALRSRLDPEDVVQEVWVRALERFSTYASQTGSFRAWTFGIARHVLLKALRTLREQVEGGGGGVLSQDLVPDDVTSASRRLARSEEVQQFLAAAEALEPSERTLLLEHGLEGRSLVELAPGLGLSPEATKKRWQRLRQKLVRTPAQEGLCAAAPEAPAHSP